MVTYSVKQISELLGVDQETVRRWIRSKKLAASDLDSNKEGHKISDESLNRFLEESPKYLAKLSRGFAGFAAFKPAIIPTVGMATYAGSMAAVVISSFLAERRKQSKAVQAEDLVAFLKDNIEKLNYLANQKRALIEQTEIEIEELHEQIRLYQQIIDNKELINREVSWENTANRIEERNKND